MVVVTEARPFVDAAALADRQRDTLSLSWEERRWTRKRVVTTAGREVGLALPTGTVLRAGDIIAIEADWYLAVEARPEPVLAAHPRSREEAVRVAFEVGNRHFSLAIEGDLLAVPDDTAMEQLLTRLGVPWERRTMAYDPIGGGHRHADATPAHVDPPASLAAANVDVDGHPDSDAHGREALRG